MDGAPCAPLQIRVLDVRSVIGRLISIAGFGDAIANGAPGALGNCHKNISEIVKIGFCPRAGARSRISVDMSTLDAPADVLCDRH